MKLNKNSHYRFDVKKKSVTVIQDITADFVYMPWHSLRVNVMKISTVSYALKRTTA